MTKAAALYSFFSQFGLPAFPSSDVPTGQAFPYLTYELTTSADLDRVPITASLWYRGSDWVTINAKVEEISAVIKDSYILEVDNGGLIIRRGTPFAQTMTDPEDGLIKRKLLSLEILYCTHF